MRQIDRRLHVHVLDVDQLRFVTWPDRLLRTRAGGGQNVERRGWLDDPEPDTPWQDTRSANRPCWRERAAYLDSEQVFAASWVRRQLASSRSVVQPRASRQAACALVT
jgi:hypothetical protein